MNKKSIKSRRRKKPEIIKVQTKQIHTCDIGIHPKLYDKDKKMIKKKPKPPPDHSLFEGIKGKSKKPYRKRYLTDGEKLLCGDMVINRSSTIIEMEKRKRMLIRSLPKYQIKRR
jgi:hypothetical protein|tara:strand:- start:1238 stop:1579 length:342 start_codon:yes stop_codon:yes gene_type:complete